jgi:hypothetical protein
MDDGAHLVTLGLLLLALLGAFWIINIERDDYIDESPILLASRVPTTQPLMASTHLYEQEVTYFPSCGFKHEPIAFEVN